MPLLCGNASNYIKDLLIEISHAQQCFTRASNDFHVPDVELYMGSFYITDHVCGILCNAL